MSVASNTSTPFHSLVFTRKPGNPQPPCNLLTRLVAQGIHPAAQGQLRRQNATDLALAGDAPFGMILVREEDTFAGGKGTCGVHPCWKVIVRA